MILKFMALVCGLVLSSAAMAQDYGLTVGVHQTNATYDGSAAGSVGKGSTSGRLNFDLGLTASFELIPNIRFRSGILYDTRGFDYKLDNGGGTVGFNTAWVDIPVNVQYNFTPMVGVYGGLIVAVKASDSMNLPSNVSYSPEVKSMVPLLNVGANFMFNDMIGFDVYGERGVGEFAKNAKDYTTVGLHFIYWL